LGPKPKKFPWQNPALNKRASVIFLSAFALVQGVPALDRVLETSAVGGFQAPQVGTDVSYEFTVEPNGIIRSSCQEGISRIAVRPSEKTVQTTDGSFREVSLQAALCTEFGFRNREVSFFVPTELLSADSEVIQGAWETKTYTGVPSTPDEGTLKDEPLTMQVRKLSDGRLELSNIPQAFEQPGFLPVQVTLSSPEEMVVYPNWRAGLLPLKDIRLEYAPAFLSKSIIIQGKLTKIRLLPRTPSGA
jgi:hypothetical protein